MDKAEKREAVAELKDVFASSETVVVAHYSGLTVADLTDLRVQMKQAGGKIKVAKNRLAKLALKDSGKEGVAEFLTGPTLLAYSEDAVTAAKITAEFAKKHDELVVVGGVMGSTTLDASGVNALAEMPSLDELRGTIAGLLVQNATNIARIVKEPAGSVARVLNAYSENGAAA